MTPALRAGQAGYDRTAHVALMLDPSSEPDRPDLEHLARDPVVSVIDTLPEQLEELVRSREPAQRLVESAVRRRIDALLGGSPPELFGRWVFYPWSRRLVHLLPEPLHRELRLDRNRYKITTAEQARLLALKVAVAGLSVGRAVVSTLVREGLCGEIRLADLDQLSLSNLNRVAGGVADVGLNKAVLAAREVAELDPYIRTVVYEGGVREETLEEFLDGADILVDECDDLAMKLRLREVARASRIPVVMVSSDRGLLDVERFDREPDREPFHGLLAGLCAADLQELTTREKVPHVLRILQAGRMRPRTAASLVEVGQTLSTWPQLASDVALGGATAANAVRRIALGELRASGRFEVDLDVLVHDSTVSTVSAVAGPRSRPPRPASVTPPVLPLPEPGNSRQPTRDEMRFLARCATLAPSGGNAQPWRFSARSGTLVATVDPTRTSLLDLNGWASCLALGAALEGALVGARALGFATEVRIPAEPATPAWTLRLDRIQRMQPSTGTPELRLLRERCCNRVSAPSPPLPPGILTALATAAHPLEVFPVTSRSALRRLGAALGELDQLRLMSPAWHDELFSELRWSREEALATRDGIDIASLELDAADLAALELVRSAPATELLGQLGLGRALGGAARDAFTTASAALVLGVRGTDPAALITGGRGLLRMWLDASARDIGVHPWGSPLVIQRWREARETPEPWQSRAIASSARTLRQAVPVPDDVTVLLVLRLTTGTRPTARSLRRDVDDVLSFEHVHRAIH